MQINQINNFHDWNPPELNHVILTNHKLGRLIRIHMSVFEPYKSQMMEINMQIS